MADKIITLDNLKTFKNKCDGIYLDKSMTQLTCEYRIVSNFSIQSIPLSNFNRTPIVGESFTIIAKYTGNTKFYYCILKVNSVNSSVAQCSFTQYTMIETTVDVASSSTLGGIKTGFTSTMINRAVVLDANNRAYVVLPEASSTRPGIIQCGYSSTVNNRALSVDSDGRGYVNIPMASSSTSGLFDNSYYNAMVYTKNRYTYVDSNYRVKEATFKSTSSGMTGLYYQIILAHDIFTGIAKVSGTIKISSYSSSDTYKYRMISPAEFNKQLNVTGIGSGAFLKGWWWGTKSSSSSLDLFGYGTGMAEQDTSYIGLGRIHTTTGSYGNWAQDTFKNNLQDGIVFFEMWFEGVGVQ